MSYQWETPSAESAIGTQVEEAAKNLHVALPVKVLSFDASKQTASCLPMIKALLAEGKSIQLPVLADVPVKFPRGGGFALTFPLKAGDEGMVIFSDRCIDGWWQSGVASEPLDLRMHDLSDACLLPGFSSVPNAIPAHDAGSIVMRKLDNSAYLKIDQGGSVEIAGTQLTVKCPIVFEQGMQGAAGSAGDAISLSGNLSHSGGSLISNGISLDQHTHSGIEPGGGNTGGPQ